MNLESLALTTSEYEGRFGGIIRDGITNPERFVKAPFKILWILKEANDPDGSGWDLREFHRNVTVYSNWRRTYSKIMDVSYGIINGITEYKKLPDELSKMSVLEDVAIINVKKIGGNSLADDKKIEAFYSESKELLLKQISAIEPQIVINCSRVWGLFKEMNGSEVLRKGHVCYGVSNERLIIHAYHPCYWSCSKENYFNDIVHCISCLDFHGSTARSTI